MVDNPDLLMPGVLSEQSSQGPLEGPGKGGPLPEVEKENQKSGVIMEDVTKELEQLTVEKNGEAVAMDEDEEPTRLSSPDSGMQCVCVCVCVCM